MSVNDPSSEPMRSSAGSAADLNSPRLFINRELSWLQFNLRVLEEAEDQRHPLLERVKFLAIYATNLDEFFMIRISGLRCQLLGVATEAPPDGMTPSEQITAIRQELTSQLSRYQACWSQDLLPKLREAGIHMLHYDHLSITERERLRQYFLREVFPTLTPLAFDPAHPFPHISNLSFNLAVVVRDPERGACFARVKLPDVFPRLVPVLNDTVDGLSHTDLPPTGKGHSFVWFEEVVAAHVGTLFPGLDVVASYPFRVTRDADLAIEEDEAADLITAVEAQVDQRDFGSAVRLELDRNTPAEIRDTLTRNLQLASYLVDTVEGPIGLASVMELTAIDRPDLKDPPFQPRIPAVLASQNNLFDAIRHEDMLLYHPYDSFTPVVDFIRQAANDPNVLAIKQTLYRVNPKSPIVEALMEARINGTQVAVVVELKARFDEENNIAWARKLEDEGVHVVYGVLGLKTHAKLCLVVRRESDGIRRYVHLGTGNYNVATSKVYTDVSYFTCDAAIGADVSDLFNALTGYSNKKSYGKLLVAPITLRQQLLDRIDREIRLHRQQGHGYLGFKLNALVDRPCIQALYRASQAGVKIDLQVRGICGLRPGIPGVSSTITVTSVVGRFLEHARIYYFRNGGQDEVLVGSADLMPRNLDRRVEILFPVEHPRLRECIITDILGTGLLDNLQARRLRSDGTAERLQPIGGDTPMSSQDWLLTHWNSEVKPVGPIPSRRSSS
ncbi:MAG TPA: polyphosphate kinase 1 [Nitrospiraceae bacterium]|nr:polyphosphate kinase 1 [Nitrospiraceae bacterium]